MLTKALIAFLPLLALCGAQIPDWEYTQELDPEGTFRLFWVVQPEAGDIVLQVQAKTVGWISLSIENPSGGFSDVIIGGYNNAIGQPYVFDMRSNIDAAGNHGALVVDPSPDVVLQRGFEYPPEAVVRWKRSLVTQDQDDVNIVPGEMTVGWAYSESSDDLSAPVAKSGLATVVFIPLSK